MATTPPHANECSAPPTRITFAEGALDAFLAHARSSDHEVGAMLLGRIEGECACVSATRSLTNVAGAPRERFDACAIAFARELREAEADGLCLVGFAHSHPDGEATPSAHDRDAAWPEAALVLSAPAAMRGARLRAYWRHGDGLREIPIHAAPREPS